MPSPMYSTAHAGHALRASLEGMNGTCVTKHIGVSRPTLSKVLDCRSGFSAEMSTGLSGGARDTSGFLV